MGNHIDTRSQRRKKTNESDDQARRRRIGFKQYLRNLEEEFEDDLLEDDLSSAQNSNQDE